MGWGNMWHQAAKTTTQKEMQCHSIDLFFFDCLMTTQSESWGAPPAHLHAGLHKLNGCTFISISFRPFPGGVVEIWTRWGWKNDFITTLGVWYSNEVELEGQVKKKSPFLFSNTHRHVFFLSKLVILSFELSLTNSSHLTSDSLFTCKIVLHSFQSHHFQLHRL